MKRWLAACLLALTVLPLVRAAPLSVSTDKSTYSPGEIVTITIRGSPGVAYGVEVRGPEGQLMAAKQVTAGSDGTATFQIGLASDCPTGTYTITVAGGGEVASTTFTVAAAAAPAPAPVAPGAAAASALSTAKFRLEQLSKAISSLNASLTPLGLEGVLANVTSALEALSAKLSEAEARFNAGDYDAAYKLASEVASECVKLLGQIFSAAVQALRDLIAEVSAATNDSLALSLLSLADKSLEEVSPTYVDSSLAAIELACKLIMAASRLAGVADLEARVSQLVSQLNATVRELERLRSEAEALQVRAGELERERSSLLQRVGELESSLSAARSKVDSLTAENQQLRSQVSQLEQRVADLERQVSTAYASAAILAAVGAAAGYFVAGRRKAVKGG